MRARIYTRVSTPPLPRIQASRPHFNPFKEISLYLRAADVSKPTGCTSVLDRLVNRLFEGGCRCRGAAGLCRSPAWRRLRGVGVTSSGKCRTSDLWLPWRREALTPNPELRISSCEVGSVNGMYSYSRTHS